MLCHEANSYTLTPFFLVWTVKWRWCKVIQMNPYGTMWLHDEQTRSYFFLFSFCNRWKQAHCVHLMVGIRCFVNFSCAILRMASFSELCQTRESTTTKRNKLHRETIVKVKNKATDEEKVFLMHSNYINNSLYFFFSICFSLKFRYNNRIATFTPNPKKSDHKSFDWFSLSFYFQNKDSQ